MRRNRSLRRVAISNKRELKMQQEKRVQNIVFMMVGLIVIFMMILVFPLSTDSKNNDVEQPFKEEMNLVFTEEMNVVRGTNTERKTKTFDKGTHMCSEIKYDVKSNIKYNLLKETNTRARVLEPLQSTFYQVCVSRDDEHHHVVEIFLDVEFGDADLYLSSHIPVPELSHHTWNSKRAGNDYIKLKTNLYDWDQESNVLFIAVQNADMTKNAKYRIRALVSRGELKRFGAGLRGTHTAFVNLNE